MVAFISGFCVDPLALSLDENIFILMSVCHRRQELSAFVISYPSMHGRHRNDSDQKAVDGGLQAIMGAEVLK